MILLFKKYKTKISNYFIKKSNLNIFLIKLLKYIYLTNKIDLYIIY